MSCLWMTLSWFQNNSNRFENINEALLVRIISARRVSFFIYFYFMRTQFILFFFCGALGFSSCIKDEPLNPEADMLSFSLPQNIMLSDPLFNKGEGEMTEVFITISKGEDVTSLTPEIAITEGATIVPAIGTVQDFTQPVTYTVTSQDGKQQRLYKVTLNSYMFYQSDFDNWDIYTNTVGTAKYELPFEYSEGEKTKIYIWSSSNRGVALYQQYLEPEKYPVASVQADGGRVAVLKTDLGPGNVMNIQYIPIVAGSLFTGTMDLTNAIKDPLSSTRFGVACDYRPDRLQGKYSYMAGSGSYILKEGNNSVELPNRKDSCALYGVFYKVDETLAMLDGNNVLTHSNIIAITSEPYRTSTPNGEMMNFDIPFVYKAGVEVDFTKYKYKLAIVFSSSYKGDLYSGTPGSKMRVENVRVTRK